MWTVHRSFLWFCALFHIVQFATGQADEIFSLQAKVEELIESVLRMVHDFYFKLKAQNRCMPENVVDEILNTMKNSIECLDAHNLNTQGVLTARKTLRKSFLKCFQMAKKQISVLMKGIELDKNYCPENMTEKTYHINVTTTYTKQFKINFKNGIEMTKVLESSDPEHILCLEGDHDEIVDDDFVVGDFNDESLHRIDPPGATLINKSSVQTTEKTDSIPSGRSEKDDKVSLRSHKGEEKEGKAEKTVSMENLQRTKHSVEFKDVKAVGKFGSDE